MLGLECVAREQPCAHAPNRVIIVSSAKGFTCDDPSTERRQVQVIETGGVPIKSWCRDCEAGTMEQAKHLARLPFAFHHVCLMPDAHEGYGMPIGGVLGALGMVIPNAVGVDIGCGMCAAGTDLSFIDTNTLKAIMSDIRTTVPLGFSRHKNAQDEHLMP